jgi:hypothetical protein
MTTGSRPSAAARGEREAGRAGPEARLGFCACCGGAGLRNWNGPKRKKVGGVKRKGFPFFKNIQTNEFKQEFEFKHSKTMHQHVCNRNSYISLFN